MTTIRMASAADADALQRIYAPYCTDTCITFELEPPSAEDFADRIETIGARYPFLVIDNGDGVIGYAYGSQHMSRAAYRWSCDSSIYIDKSETGKGYGTVLYSALLEQLDQYGFYNVYGGVTLPNQASVAIHKSLGFEEFAIYKQVGFKHGRWLDVAWLRKTFRPFDDQPKEPLLPDRQT